MNRLLCRKTPLNRFVTLFLCHLERSGRGVFVSAGHNTSFVFRAAAGELEELGSGGMPLGMFSSAAYRPSPVELAPGDVLVFYSDGLTDAENGADLEFGEGRLRALIRAHAAEGAEAPEKSLLDELDRLCRRGADRRYYVCADRELFSTLT